MYNLEGTVVTMKLTLTRASQLLAVKALLPVQGLEVFIKLVHVQVRNRPKVTVWSVSCDKLSPMGTILKARPVKLPKCLRLTTLWRVHRPKKMRYYLFIWLYTLSLFFSR